MVCSRWTSCSPLALTTAAVHKRVAAGRLHRIHQTVYSLVPRRQMKFRPHELRRVLVKLLPPAPGSPGAPG
jgi:hypothetical protein